MNAQQNNMFVVGARFKMSKLGRQRLPYFANKTGTVFEVSPRTTGIAERSSVPTRARSACGPSRALMNHANLRRDPRDGRARGADLLPRLSLRPPH
jgi:hypothetical protein